MRTRSQARRLRQQQRQQQQVPPNLVEAPKDTMADNRTMAELLCWEIQVKRSKFCHEKVKVLLNEKVKVLPVKDRSTAVDIGT
ncbi:hypothetical protein Tco_0636316, partial [Tanacetum coccineum]